MVCSERTTENSPVIYRGALQQYAGFRCFSGEGRVISLGQMPRPTGRPALHSHGTVYCTRVELSVALELNHPLH